jgi:hypothetical protein
MVRRRAAAVFVWAFTTACREFGVTAHDDGECPPGCRCAELEEQIEARGLQLIQARLDAAAAGPAALDAAVVRQLREILLAARDDADPAT